MLPQLTLSDGVASTELDANIPIESELSRTDLCAIDDGVSTMHLHKKIYPPHT